MARFKERRPKRKYFQAAKRRTSRRRSYAKKRTYRKKPMTKTRILNVTSTKKRDTMLNWTNSTASSQVGGSTYSSVPAIITGGANAQNCASFLWCATARDATTSSAGGQSTKYSTSARSATACYMVGLAEKIEIQCNTGMPWQWRRICFTMKGLPLVPISTASGAVFSDFLETSNGYMRVMNQVNGNPSLDPMYTLFGALFKGQVNSDWQDPMIAPTDNSRLTVKYDKVITLSSGNEDGFIRSYKRWHPMSKTLVYNDDEIGGGMFTATKSALGKAGMGDFYVCDIFRARQGSASTDQLSVCPEATLYWHEK
ncbi:capsid protein [Blackfly genomovirus 3]|nr:capsid protein [Blackfly genomovirus 3]